MTAAVAVAARRDALPLGAIFLAIALAAAVGAAVLPLDRLPFAACTFKALTGWPCLTCGSTRAFARLAAGDLGGAFAMNPLTTAGALALVPWGTADLALLARGRAVAIELGPAAWRVLRVALPVALAANWSYLVAAGI